MVERTSAKNPVGCPNLRSNHRLTRHEQTALTHSPVFLTITRLRFLKKLTTECTLNCNCDLEEYPIAFDEIDDNNISNLPKDFPAYIQKLPKLPKGRRHAIREPHEVKRR